MSDDLRDFFSEISKSKKEKKEKLEEAKEELNSIVGDLGLDSLFQEFGKIKKEEVVKKKKQEKKLEAFENFFSNIDEKKEEEPIVEIEEVIEEPKEVIEEIIEEPVVAEEEIEEEIVAEEELEDEKFEEEVEEVLEDVSLIEKSLGMLAAVDNNEDPLTPVDKKFATMEDFQKHYGLLIQRIQQQLSTIGGGGAVNIKDMDDVDLSTAQVDNKFLKYNSASGKWVGSDTSGGGYTLPTAAADTLGGIKIGSGLSIDGSGVVTSSGGGGSDTDTTYSISCVDGDNADEEKIRLTAGGDGSGTDDVVLEAGTGLSIARSGDKITFTNTVTDTNTQLTTEEVQDIIGAMVAGNTETNISVTYDDTNGKLDFASTDTDTNTTYSVVTSSADGLAPQLPGSHGGKFLKADGTWEVPPDTNTTYSVQDGQLSQNNFTDTDHTKLDGIETSADVTDATNVDSAGAIMNSDLDGKGEILIGDGSGDPTALAVGTNDYVLKADSGEATGVKWAPATGLFVSYAKISDVKGGTTQGGTASAGWQFRDLNTENWDPDGIVLGLDGKATSGNLKTNGTNYTQTTSSQKFALGAGTYAINMRVPFGRINRCLTYLRQEDIDGSNLIVRVVGGTKFSSTSSNWIHNDVVESFDRFTITETKIFGVNMNAQTASTNTYALGISANNTALNSIYTEVEIYKE
jgi:hypothetical protein